MTAQLLEKACEGEFVGACFNLGVKYNKDEGVKKDKTQALMLYETACSSEHKQACYS